MHIYIIAWHPYILFKTQSLSLTSLCLLSPESACVIVYSSRYLKPWVNLCQKLWAVLVSRPMQLLSLSRTLSDSPAAAVDLSKLRLNWLGNRCLFSQNLCKGGWGLASDASIVWMGSNVSPNWSVFNLDGGRLQTCCFRFKPRTSSRCTDIRYFEKGTHWMVQGAPS